MNPKTEAPEGIKNHCDREFLNIYSPSSSCDDERDRNIFIDGYFSSYDLLWPQIEMLKEALEKYGYEFIYGSEHEHENKKEQYWTMKGIHDHGQIARQALDRLKEIEG